MHGYVGTGRCRRCYNVESRLWDYISTKKGHDFVLLMLVKKAEEDLKKAEKDNGA